MAVSTIKKLEPVQLQLLVHDISAGNLGPVNHSDITATIDCGSNIPIAVVGCRFTGTGSYSLTTLRRRFTIDQDTHKISVRIRTYGCVASISVTGIHCYVYYLVQVTS